MPTINPTPYAIACYDPNKYNFNCWFLNSVKYEEDSPPVFSFSTFDKGFEVFYDLEVAKHHYSDLLQSLIKDHPFSPFESYAQFYKIIKLTTSQGFKPYIKNVEEFDNRAVCDYTYFSKFVPLNESSFTESFSDIIWKLQQFETDDINNFTNFKFQSLNQYRAIKAKNYPNDSIYYTFKYEKGRDIPKFIYLAHINENSIKEDKMMELVTFIDPCSVEMIKSKYRILDEKKD